MVDSIAKELKIKIVINILEKTATENKFKTETYLGSKKDGIPEINLYFRPGHYDICYLKKYAKKYYNSIYKSSKLN